MKRWRGSPQKSPSGDPELQTRVDQEGGIAILIAEPRWMNGGSSGAQSFLLPEIGAFKRETNVSWRSEIAQAKANIGNPMNHGMLRYAATSSRQVS